MPTAVIARQRKARSVDETARRERGLQRIERLLRAAEEVFAEVGYERATTNLIAAKASSSPGTFYQFFESKQEIAEAICRRYAEQLFALLKQVYSKPYRTSSEALDTVIDRHAEFLASAPAYGELLSVSGLSEDVMSVRTILMNTAVEGIADLLAQFATGLKPHERLFHAQVCVTVFRGFVPMLQHGSRTKRHDAATALKQMIERYLAPMLVAEPRA